MNRFPSIFVSHGSPMLAVEPGAAAEFLSSLGRKLERPKAILVVSAHWETAEPTVSTAENPATIHDFGGFPKALYQLQYPALGAPELASAVVQHLTKANLPARTDPTRGMDHGAWVPLRLIYPNADIPVTQLSIQTHLGAAHHLKVGEALSPLLDQGVLILASGSATHNLGELRRQAAEEAPTWVIEFDRWLREALHKKDVEALLDYRTRAPYAQHNHPSEEHLLPLFVALGTGRDAELLHSSYTYGVLSMSAYSFGQGQTTQT
jgi:4,5-DOPA dioxygenase extradiol